MGRIIFNQLFTAPAAVARVDDSALNGVSVGGSGTLAIVGVAGGGQPDVPIRFTSAQGAINTLRTGDALSAVLRAFSPGRDIPGAPLIYVVRVNKATQSSLNLAAGTVSSVSTPGAPTLTPSDTGGSLANGSTYNYRISAINSVGETVPGSEGTAATVVGPFGSISVTWSAVSGATGYRIYGRTTGSEQLLATVIGNSSTQFTDDGSLTPSGAIPGSNTTAGSLVAMTLTSNDYGIQTRQIRVSIGTGAGSLGKAVSVQYGTVLISKAAVYQKAINVALVDASSTYTAATLAIAGTVLTLVLTPSVGSPTTTTFDLTVYTTLQSIVDALNNFGHGVAAAVTGLSASGSSLQLDEVSAAGIRVTSSLDPGVDFFANNLAIMNFLTATGLVTATPGAVRKAPDNTAGFVYLGSDNVLHLGTDYGRDDSNNIRSGLTTQDWSDALDAMLTIDCSVITAASPDSTVHAMLQTHVDQASSLSVRKERVAVVGGDSGETISQAENRAISLADPRVMLCWPAVLDADTSSSTAGATVVIPPYLLAAQLGGMFCGGGIADPLTHRYITAIATELRLTPEQIDELLDSGVCPIEVVPGRGIRVVQSRSTWTADDNFRNNEISVMRTTDELIKRVRSTADDRLVGRIISSDMLQACVSLTQVVLQQAQRDGIITGTPAFQNITASSDGDLVSVDFECFLALPANFIAITAHVQPFTGLATA